MPAEVKKEIDILSHFIIDNNPDFRSTYEEICELRRLYNEMLHSDETNYGKLQLATFMGKINDEIESSIGNAILKLIMKEQKAGHWNTSADNSFQAHNDTELPHDEAPPFSMISLIQTRTLIETLRLVPIMTCLTVRHLYHESCISAHLQ